MEEIEDLPPSTCLSSTSQTQLTTGSDRTPSATSSTNNASTSWPSVEEYFSPPTFKMTDKHELILENTRQGNQWQQDMDCGFTEGESCECFSRAGLYKDADEFPVGVVNERLFPHALGMWVILKEADRLQGVSKGIPGSRQVRRVQGSYDGG
jgi:hypothetical protein